MAGEPNRPESGPEYLPTPEERARNRARAHGRDPEGPNAGRGWWGRRSNSAKAAIVIGVLAVAGVIVAAATSGNGGKGGSEQSLVTVTNYVKTVVLKPEKTPAQRRAEARARARAARLARARARAAARARVAAARRRAAYIAAANAWHRGYYEQDGNVFWQWRNGVGCQDYAVNGCWHVAVTTRNGCSSYVAVDANEYQGSSIIGHLLDNQGYGIPAKTVRIFELDADTGGSLRAGNVHVDCE